MDRATPLHASTGQAAPGQEHSSVGGGVLRSANHHFGLHGGPGNDLLVYHHRGDGAVQEGADGNDIHCNVSGVQITLMNGFDGYDVGCGGAQMYWNMESPPCNVYAGF